MIEESWHRMVDKLVLEEATQWFVDQKFQTYDSDLEGMLLNVIKKLKDSIPEKRKASYGIVSVIAVFCKAIFKTLEDSTYEVGLTIYRGSKDFRTISLGLGLVSHVGVKEPQRALPILKHAANHEVWEVKEFVQMFIRKITKANKAVVQDFLLNLAGSDNANLRRFASESLRPVVENKWIHETPDYSLKVLRKLFKESDEFPKISVANNLSDLSRKNPELIYEIVEELVNLNDPNSDFIAYRACRNLVKSDPARVMDLLGLEYYSYKKNTYSRKDYS